MINQKVFYINKKNLKRRIKLEKKWNFWYKVDNIIIKPFVVKTVNILIFLSIAALIINGLMILINFKTDNFAVLKKAYKIIVIIFTAIFFIACSVKTFLYFLEPLAEKKKKRYIDYCLICSKCGGRIVPFNHSIEVLNGAEKRIFGDICENCGNIENESFYHVKVDSKIEVAASITEINKNNENNH